MNSLDKFMNRMTREIQIRIDREHVSVTVLKEAGDTTLRELLINYDFKCIEKHGVLYYYFPYSDDVIDFINVLKEYVYNIHIL